MSVDITFLCFYVGLDGNKMAYVWNMLHHTTFFPACFRRLVNSTIGRALLLNVTQIYYILISIKVTIKYSKKDFLFSFNRILCSYVLLFIYITLTSAQFLHAKNQRMPGRNWMQSIVIAGTCMFNEPVSL